MELFDQIADKKLLVRRLTLTANHVVDEKSVKKQPTIEQLNLFTDYDMLERERQKEAIALERERRLQHAVLNIRKKYGKNALLKGMDLQEGATTIERNKQIGGHKA